MQDRDERINALLKKIDDQEKTIEVQNEVIRELMIRLNEERERIVRRHGLTLLEVTR